MNLRRSVALAVIASSVAIGWIMFGGGKTKAAGPICSVPGDYATIQAAVNDPGCSTINVGPGLYAENVAINRTLTLNGAQAGNAFAGRTFGGAGESTVTGTVLVGGVAVITINAPNVTVDGFSLTNSVTTGAAFGITVRGLGNDALITNNIIDTVNTADTGGNGTAQAIFLSEGGPDNVSVVANEMNNIRSNRSAKGVLLGSNGGTNPSLNTLIKDNSITNITSDTRGAYGVSVANVVGVSGLKVQDNTIDTLTGTIGWAHAIGLEGDTPGAIVTGNSISNVIASGLDRIAVWFESNPSFSSAQVHNNNFNDGIVIVGIGVHPALSGTPVSGTCNWWGSASGPGPVGPGAGAKVSANVDYTPWLTAPGPGGVCAGPDADGDGVTDSEDNCPATPNPDQDDWDNDGVGDACDPPANKDQCKNGGWANFIFPRTFKNQGDCIQYVNTGK